MHTYWFKQSHEVKVVSVTLHNSWWPCGWHKTNAMMLWWKKNHIYTVLDHGVRHEKLKVSSGKNIETLAILYTVSNQTWEFCSVCKCQTVFVIMNQIIYKCQKQWSLWLNLPRWLLWCGITLPWGICCFSLNYVV